MEGELSIHFLRVGQEIASHIRPYCQYTWIVLSGVADYYEESSAIANIKSGDIAVAKPGQIDGVMNSDSTELFNLVSVATLARLACFD